MRETLTNLPRRIKQGIAILVDVVLIALSLVIAISLRIGEFHVPSGVQLLVVFIAPLVAVPIFARFGLYRAVFRYISVHMGWAIAKAVGLFTLVLGTIIFLLGSAAIPRSAILINALVAFLAVSGSRVIARWWFTSHGKLSLKPDSNLPRILIYGAGAAGVQLASALVHSHEVVVVGFVDDRKDLQKKVIRGLTVHPTNQMAKLVQTLKVDEVLLAIPSAPRSRRREIVHELDKLRIEVRTLPGLAELAQGKVRISDLRKVEISDILGRDAVQPNEDLLHKNITGKAVLVTGAGGSIGSELCRQICALDPSSIILYERSEHALYEIDRELNGLSLKFPIISILGSVLDEALLTQNMSRHGVQTVYHAAAYKHVPLVEANPAQGVYNNVFGTWRAARAARSSGVEAFVLISTDKAVRPTNIMGASKRLAEMVLQCMSTKSDMLMTMVRFGNVLGSSGSVVPLFREQIAGGGPVTVTHPEVTRYFMTIPEASQLVIQAGAMGQGGDVFVLDMGESIKIVDLARRMIRLSGYEVRDENNPDGEIEIQFSGLRPGEKLFEELLIGTNTSETSHPLILRAEEHHSNEETLEWILGQLEDAIVTDNSDRIQQLMAEAVTEYFAQNGDLTKSPSTYAVQI
ncbi:polysaccharide biosynthesis protein [bacterium]|nr:polysaccharide biosynthesis protein [bacterium]